RSMKFISGSRRKPFRVQIARLSRSQTAHRTVNLRFKVVRGCVRVIAERKNSFFAQPRFRAVCPEDNRGLAWVGFVFVELKTLNHGVLAATIDYCQPALSGVQPQFSRHVHVMDGKEAIVSHRYCGILRRTEANMIAVEITAGGIGRGEGPKIVVEAGGRGRI